MVLPLTYLQWIILTMKPNIIITFVVRIELDGNDTFDDAVLDSIVDALVDVENAMYRALFSPDRVSLSPSPPYLLHPTLSPSLLRPPARSPYPQPHYNVCRSQTKMFVNGLHTPDYYRKN